jgi:hypothetical protein
MREGRFRKHFLRRRKKTCGLGRNQTKAQDEERGILKLRRVGYCWIFV